MTMPAAMFGKHVSMHLLFCNIQDALRYSMSDTLRSLQETSSVSNYSHSKQSMVRKPSEYKRKLSKLDSLGDGQGMAQQGKDDHPRYATVMNPRARSYQLDSRLPIKHRRKSCIYTRIGRFTIALSAYPFDILQIIIQITNPSFPIARNKRDFRLICSSCPFNALFLFRPPDFAHGWMVRTLKINKLK